MSRRRLAASAAIWAVLVSGCSSDGLSENPLSGRIGGEAWTFAEGYAEPAPPEATELHVTLYSEPVEQGCSASLLPGNKVLFRMPRETGTYALSLLQSVTLVVEVEGGVDNYIATFGEIDVRQISEVAVEAGLVASFNHDPNLSVNGTFTVEVCPWLE